MGNYTQFNAEITLRKDTPDDVVLLIMHAVYDPDFYACEIDWRNGVYSDHPLILPDHPFFKLERWDGIFMGPNFYHDHGAKFTKDKKGYYHLEIHCDINHGFNEVKEFVKWITPYVAGRKKKQYIGWWKMDDLWNRDRNYIHIENDHRE